MAAHEKSSRDLCGPAPPFLRLQRVDDEEAGGEIEVHAPQSGKARTGRLARIVAMEQLPLLCSRRIWRGAGQRRLGRDFVSRRGLTKEPTQNTWHKEHRLPPLQSTQGRGTLFCLGVSTNRSHYFIP